MLCIGILYGKVCFKFRVLLKVWHYIQSKTRVKPPVTEAVEAAYSLNTPSDEQRPFYGGSARMEIKNITLWIKPSLKIIV